jgi:hypothetical protein
MLRESSAPGAIQVRYFVVSILFELTVCYVTIAFLKLAAERISAKNMHLKHFVHFVLELKLTTADMLHLTDFQARLFSSLSFQQLKNKLIFILQNRNDDFIYTNRNSPYSTLVQSLTRLDFPAQTHELVNSETPLLQSEQNLVVDQVSDKHEREAASMHGQFHC